MHNIRVLAVVLAGGEGKRLMPLTEDRAKPAVPFGGSYRLIDFALSNVVNSGYLKVVVLTQYKSHSLDRHISETWRMSTHLGNYVASVPAQQRRGKEWFLGSANAIYQSMNLIHDDRPDIVVVIGADHVYRMNFSQMVQAHIESGAAATVAAVRQPMELCSSFGVIETDADNPSMVKNFAEKPKTTQGLPDSPEEFLASMGNYVFDTHALLTALEQDSKRKDTAHDMGGDIIPYFVSRGECGVYDFTTNTVAGEPYDDENCVRYWRDVGTLDSYYDANMDLIKPLPDFNLYNMDWPIFTRQSHSPPAKIVRAADGTPGSAYDSLLSQGVVLTGGAVIESVLSPDVRVEKGATVKDSVLLDGVVVAEGAMVQRAIIDKNVVIPAGTRIGFDHVEDAQNGYHITESGLTVLSKGQKVPRK